MTKKGMQWNVTQNMKKLLLRMTQRKVGRLFSGTKRGYIFQNLRGLMFLKHKCKSPEISIGDLGFPRCVFPDRFLWHKNVGWVGQPLQQTNAQNDMTFFWGKEIPSTKPTQLSLLGRGGNLTPFLGGGFKDFYFHPYLGKIPILTNILQMGWNHQLGTN